MFCKGQASNLLPMYTGLIFDDSPHYIDHLAPFCALMDWPLVVWEDSIANAVRQFYPQVQLIHDSIVPPNVVACDNRALLKLYGITSGRMLWLPHGLSDKGWKSSFFETLGEEDLLLVYGQRMRDVLAAKKVTIPQLSVGNFRWKFYQQHREFYNKLMTERFGDRRFILYAPTWEDSEKNSTLWDVLPKLEQNVLVKVHPNTQKRFMPELERAKGRVEILEDFPPIYPLLDRTDIYIGDMSSIGYDFLHFNKPMFFLCREKTQDESTFLMRCGTQITMDQVRPSTPDHSAMLSYAFDKFRRIDFAASPSQ